MFCCVLKIIARILLRVQNHCSNFVWCFDEFIHMVLLLLLLYYAIAIKLNLIFKLISSLIGALLLTKDDVIDRFFNTEIADETT